ncbi:hypothetical protein ADL34_00230 [Streptomyces sp. NRRL WC-3605]|nr:hypothetical protein ADL34_00230 [Streptomyces sp. NRRL WC-3605]KUL81189.1 hypothetical protein ADL33_01850 [Streptomyces sp. NRRL WC-3604]
MLTRYTRRIWHTWYNVSLAYFVRILRVASVPSPPGTSRTQVVGPLAQSATAMHISTRLLF